MWKYWSDILDKAHIGECEAELACLPTPYGKLRIVVGRQETQKVLALVCDNGGDVLYALFNRQRLVGLLQAVKAGRDILDAWPERRRRFRHARMQFWYTRLTALPLSGLRGTVVISLGRVVSGGLPDIFLDVTDKHGLRNLTFTFTTPGTWLFAHLTGADAAVLAEALQLGQTMIEDIPAPTGPKTRHSLTVSNWNNL